MNLPISPLRVAFKAKLRRNFGKSGEKFLMSFSTVVIIVVTCTVTRLVILARFHFITGIYIMQYKHKYCNKKYLNTVIIVNIVIIVVITVVKMAA